MPVTVTPAQFTLVEFDPELIRSTVEDLLDRLGIGDRDVRVEVDETSPITTITATPGDVIVVHAESGALEDPRRPRHVGPDTVVVNVGRVLLRLLDREGGFADAPDDAALSLAQRSAWDTWSAGRLARAGYAMNEQRWRYGFRNRHGFSDEADAAFDRLWSATALTWDELAALSEAARAVVA